MYVFHRVAEKIKEHNVMRWTCLCRVNIQQLSTVIIPQFNIPSFYFIPKSTHADFSSLHGMISSYLHVFFFFFLFLVPGQVWMITVLLSKLTPFKKKSSMCYTPSMELQTFTWCTQQNVLHLETTKHQAPITS